MNHGPFGNMSKASGAHGGNDWKAIRPADYTAAMVQMARLLLVEPH